MESKKAFLIGEEVVYGDCFVIFTMMIIGALVGGVTNFLAIKMLFRPYYPVYLGSWKIPFTPGLIPKRREEMARSFGRMVATHLITPQQFTELLNQHELRAKIEEKGASFISAVCQSERSPEEIAKQWGEVSLVSSVPPFMEQHLETRMTEWWELIQNKTLEDALPAEVVRHVDEEIPKVADLLLHEGVRWLEGDEGRREIGKAVDDFFASRNQWLGMMQMFIGQDRIEDKIQHELVRFLRREQSRPMVEKILHKKWREIKTQQICELVRWLPASKMPQVADIARFAVKRLAIEKTLQTPLYKLIDAEMEAKLQQLWVQACPRFINQAGVYVERIFNTLRLDEIVEKQVASFPVERLEELVLSISKREFSMITYLGAFLGGLIGLLQAGIVLLFPF
ncbi:DUF445 domain-containing protein [Bacillaceae bacterium SIJ1]|uniref:DUF445 domain-containing protein n=1 Tax=Litoribacterium kuwaitense TaxID=1398745 RepID=UPI0013EB686B|nr:DUF445 family protein [Litoribacterium kuwaitense]NGP43893.1 DUF445 domain-containing protein [Litoribacterium kuwaitense]